GGYNGRKSGRVFVEGEQVELNKPIDSIKQGLAYVSEDRKRYGLVLGMDIIKNTTLSSLQKVKRNRLLDSHLELEKAELYAKKMNLKTHSLEATVDQLSGGNQQKV